MDNTEPENQRMSKTRICYYCTSEKVGEHIVVVVQENVSGYKYFGYRTWNDEKDCEAEAARLNAVIGISDKDMVKIVASSMFGG